MQFCKQMTATIASRDLSDDHSNHLLILISSVTLFFGNWLRRSRIAQRVPKTFLEIVKCQIRRAAAIATASCIGTSVIKAASVNIAPRVNSSVRVLEHMGTDRRTFSVLSPLLTI